MSITATSTTFNPLSSLYTFCRTPTNFPHCSVFTSPLRYNGAQLLGFVPRAVSSQEHGVFDSELHSVLQLATGSELYEVERILFGTSYFSPLLKSIAKPSDIDYVMIEEDPEEREEFISILEARFFFLAADARSSLRGWRPTYRNVLLGVRKELKIPCSTKLSTEDLEIEIFLHLLQEYSRGADMVLGVQWLATLNTVQANWKEMFLKFNINGKAYKLLGPFSDLQQSATLWSLLIEPLRHTTLVQGLHFLLPDLRTSCFFGQAPLSPTIGVGHNGLGQTHLLLKGREMDGGKTFNCGGEGE